MGHLRKARPYFARMPGVGLLLLIFSGLYSFSLVAESEAPRILEHSVRNLYIYHGDNLRLEVSAVGSDLNYQWSLVKGEGAERRFIRICSRANCVIRTKKWPLGNHQVELAVTDEFGGSFLDFYINVVPRPSEEIGLGDYQADVIPIEAGAVRSVTIQGIRDNVHDGSRFSQSLHQFLLEKDFAAKTGFTYSLWNEADYRDLSKEFLARLAARKIISFSLYGAFEYDSNVLRQSAREKIPEELGFSNGQRQAFHSLAKLEVRLWKAENHRIDLTATDERFTQLKPLRILGLDETNPISILDSEEQRIGLRYQFRGDAVDEEKASFASLEPYFRQQFIAKSSLERAYGLRLAVREHSFTGKPEVSAIMERRKDPKPDSASLIHPAIHELNLAIADLSSNYMEFHLVLLPIEKHNKLIRTYWNFAKIIHSSKAAKPFNYSQQTFGLKGQYAANMRHSFGADIALRSRFFLNDPLARLDRQSITGLEWSWFAKPYLSRVFRVELESSQSSLYEKTYNRLLFSMSGEFRY